MGLFGNLRFKKVGGLFRHYRQRRRNKLSESIKKAIERVERFKQIRPYPPPPPPPKRPIPIPTEEYVEISGGIIELDVAFHS